MANCFSKLATFNSSGSFSGYNSLTFSSTCFCRLLVFHVLRLFEKCSSKHVDEKVKELYPEKDPLELKVANLEKQLAMKEMRSFAMDKAHKEGLPLELVDLVMGEDQEKTSSNLDLLKGVFSQHIENKTQERLKADGIDPKGSQEPPKTFTMEQLKNMSEEEYIKNQEAVDAYLNSQSN